jgi:transposase
MLERRFIHEIVDLRIKLDTFVLRIGMKYKKTKHRDAPRKEINLEFFKENDKHKFNYHMGRLEN